MRRRFAKFPSLLRRWLACGTTRDPFLLKRIHGTTGITSIQSHGFSNPLFTLPPAIHTLSFSVGNLCERLALADDGSVVKRKVLCLTGAADHDVDGRHAADALQLPLREAARERGRARRDVRRGNAPAARVEDGRVVRTPRPVPEEPGHWLLGSARKIARAPHRFMRETAERHGGIAQFRVLRRRIVVILQPEMARQVPRRLERCAHGLHNRNLGIVSGDGLLSTEGEEWRTRRRQVQPAFRRECLERLVPVVAASVDPILGEWERRRASGKPVPLSADMLRLTMRAMGRMLLSADIPEDQGARIGVILRDGLMLLRKRNTSLWPAPMWLPTPANRRLLRYRDELTEFVETHLLARENGGASGVARHSGAAAGGPIRTPASRSPGRI